MDLLVLLLLVLLLVLGVFGFYFFRLAKGLEQQLSDLSFSKSSQSVKYGKLTEQWIPFSDRFPFDAERFRFLGNPIDGVAFLDSKIVFCEFKTASSQLSDVQKKIKNLVEQKKVEWLEFKIR